MTNTAISSCTANAEVCNAFSSTTNCYDALGYSDTALGSITAYFSSKLLPTFDNPTFNKVVEFLGGKKAFCELPTIHSTEDFPKGASIAKGMTKNGQPFIALNVKTFMFTNPRVYTLTQMDPESNELEQSDKHIPFGYTAPNGICKLESDCFDRLRNLLAGEEISVNLPQLKDANSGEILTAEVPVKLAER